MVSLKLSPYWCNTNSQASLCIFPLQPCHSWCWADDGREKLSPPTSKGHSSSEVLSHGGVQMTFSLTSQPPWDLCMALTSSLLSFLWRCSGLNVRSSLVRAASFRSSLGCRWQADLGTLQTHASGCGWK